MSRVVFSRCLLFLGCTAVWAEFIGAIFTGDGRLAGAAILTGFGTLAALISLRSLGDEPDEPYAAGGLVLSGATASDAFADVPGLIDSRDVVSYWFWRDERAPADWFERTPVQLDQEFAALDEQLRRPALRNRRLDNALARQRDRVELAPAEHVAWLELWRQLEDGDGLREVAQ